MSEPAEKHRHKWQPTRQTVASGLVIEEDCVCVCGAVRRMRPAEKGVVPTWTCACAPGWHDNREKHDE